MIELDFKNVPADQVQEFAKPVLMELQDTIDVLSSSWNRMSQRLAEIQQEINEQKAHRARVLKAVGSPVKVERGGRMYTFSDQGTLVEFIEKPAP